MHLKKRAVAVVLALFILSSFLPSCFADGENWLTGWDFRQSVEVSQISEFDTSFQVDITINFTSGTSENNTCYVNECCRADFADIRFTDNDGQTLLDYWLKNSSVSDFAIFTVEIIDDLSAANVTIYVYYGNYTASSLSDGFSTFLFFDDFNDASLNMTTWTYLTDDGSITTTESGGYLNFYGTSSFAYHKEELYGDSFSVSQSYFIDYLGQTTTPTQTKGELKCGMYVDNNNKFYHGLSKWASPDYDTLHRTVTVDDSAVYAQVVSSDALDTNWHEYGAFFNYTTGDIEFYYDGLMDDDNTDVANNAGESAQYPILVAAIDTGTWNFNLDWISIRAFTGDTLYYIWGSVESEPITGGEVDSEFTWFLLVVVIIVLAFAFLVMR